MTAKKLFLETMPFVRAKLMLGLITTGISLVLLGIFMGLGWLFGGGGMMIMLIFWLAAVRFIQFLILHYTGYLLKAGHAAVIVETIMTGQVPENQVAYGKAKVTERFAVSNVYFVVDNLVGAAVRQLQGALGKVGDILDFIPGMDAVTGLAQAFVGISLGYVDECCLGWTFYKKEQGAFQSAADGVVIYAQNWKELLGSAARTMVKALLIMAATAFAVFVPVGLMFRLLRWSPMTAFLISCLVMWMIKFAVMDSYIMIQMMTAYMKVAPSTRITFDLYDKLCGLSSKFKELFQKGQAETPVVPAQAYAPAASERNYGRL